MIDVVYVVQVFVLKILVWVFGLVFFILDLYLMVSMLVIVVVFECFLCMCVCEVCMFVILGDFFEYWVGDEELVDLFYWYIVNLFVELVVVGMCVLFMYGN